MNLLTEQLESPPTSALSRVIYRNDKNVEVLRQVDLLQLRASPPMRGTPWGNISSTTPEGITYHNHHELVGIKAGIQDATDGVGLNIVRSGKYRAYYVGQRENLGLTGDALPTMLARGKRPSLNELVLHDDGKRAFLLQSEVNLDKTANKWLWDDKAPQYVDYDAANKLLSGIDATSSGAAKAFDGLPRVARAVHPDDLSATTLFTAGSNYERKLKLAGSR
jgi:hypothetical protein